MAPESQPPRSRETQAIVWLDGDHANVFHVMPTDELERVVHAAPRAAVEHLPGEGGHNDEHYFHQVAYALDGARRILVVGPGPAKLSLLRHIVHHDPNLENRIVGLETLDDPQDERLVQYARRYLG